MFDIYTKDIEVEINGETQKYKFRPLSGRFLPRLYSVIGAMQKVEDTEKTLQSLEEKDFANLHTLVLETFKASYPKEDADKLDLFVSQNLFKFVEPVMQVNMNADEPKSKQSE